MGAARRLRAKDEDARIHLFCKANHSPVGNGRLERWWKGCADCKNGGELTSDTPEGELEKERAHLEDRTSDALPLEPHTCAMNAIWSSRESWRSQRRMGCMCTGAGSDAWKDGVLDTVVISLEPLH